MSNKNYSPACKRCGGEDCICCEIYQDSLYESQVEAANYENRYDDPFGRYSNRSEEDEDEYEQSLDHAPLPARYLIHSGNLYKPAPRRRLARFANTRIADCLGIR